MHAFAPIPAPLLPLVDALLDHAMRCSGEVGSDELLARLHTLTREARRLSVPLDALVFALRDTWLRVLHGAPGAERALGERFVRVAHACIREYLRADARAVVDPGAPGETGVDREPPAPAFTA